jgi:hypothetical protein
MAIFANKYRWRLNKRDGEFQSKMMCQPDT